MFAGRLPADPDGGRIFSIPVRAGPSVPEDGPEIPGPEIPPIEKAAAVLPQVFPASTDKEIMGKGETGAGILASFLLVANDGADPDFVKELVSYYLEESEVEGVNHDVAFAQMCLETGFLRYGGLVTPDMNNFCGLGAIGPGEPGETFSSPRIGVRAHIQHLKAYATDKPLERDSVDPRQRWVRKGSAPAIKHLAGTWAADRQYADKIGIILTRLYRFKETGFPETVD